MGRTHALTGCVAGLAVAPLAGASGFAETVLFAVVCAGWAIVPDLDHPSASASRVLGPITGALSWALRKATGAFYRATKGPRDEASEHRAVTHTALFSLVIGVSLGFAGTVSPWATVAVAGFGVLLAADRLGNWLWVPILGGLGLWFGTGTSLAAMLHTAGGLSWALGVAAGCGCLVHVCGDMITKSGAPLLFPIVLNGESYAEIRPPRFLRFRTGGRVENWLVTPLSLAALALLVLPLISSLPS